MPKFCFANIKFCFIVQYKYKTFFNVLNSTTAVFSSVGEVSHSLRIIMLYIEVLHSYRCYWYPYHISGNGKVTFEGLLAFCFQNHFNFQFSACLRDTRFWISEHSQYWDIVDKSQSSNASTEYRATQNVWFSNHRICTRCNTGGSCVQITEYSR